METEQKATLHVIFVNSYGDKTEVIKDLDGDTCPIVVAAFRESLLGFGFHPDSVEELIPETVYDFS